MVYVVIGLILLFIILPILAMLPSARQREQMQMRRLARAAGVTVQLTSIEDPNPDRERYTTGTGRALPPLLKVVVWSRGRETAVGWRQLPEVNWCLQRNPDKSWRWSGEVPAAMSEELKAWLDEALVSLPEDVEQVQESRYRIEVCWHERSMGTEQLVLDFLEHCAKLPLHK